VSRPEHCVRERVQPPGLSTTGEGVSKWRLKATWFGLMANVHPRWSETHPQLLLLRSRGFFKGAKTYEGKAPSA